MVSQEVQEYRHIVPFTKKKVDTFPQWHQGILIFSTADKNPCQNDIHVFAGKGVEKALVETVWLSTLSYFEASKGLPGLCWAS